MKIQQTSPKWLNRMCCVHLPDLLKLVEKGNARYSMLKINTVKELIV